MLKKHPLLVFTIGYLFIWIGLTLLIHSQTSISPDTAENMMWGMNLSFMYDKHPGLGPFFLQILTPIFPPLLANLIASAVCIITAWIFIYKLSKIYYQKQEAIFITILSAMNFFFMGEFFLQYNQNIILLPFWCASAYFFAKSVNENRLSDWVLLDIVAALGIYAKFQIGLLFLSMVLYLVLNFDKKYLKNILISFIVYMVVLLPGLISLYNLDFSTIRYIFDRTGANDTHLLFNTLRTIFDIFFQLLNLAFAFLVIAYLKRKNNIEFKNKRNSILIIMGLLPYLIFFILEEFKGELPVEWLVVVNSLLTISLYSLFKIRIKNINFKSIIIFGLLVNLVYFIGFNLNTFSDKQIEHNNIGSSVAIAADNFISKNNLAQPQYVSGNWKYSLYLPIFMKNKPAYIRNWEANKNSKQDILLIFDGCGKQFDNTIIKNGYAIKKQECTEIYPIDKFSPKPNKFSYYLVQKVKSA